VVCILGRVAVVKKLLEHGVNIEEKDLYGETPLHNASLGGYLPVVKALVSGGVDDLDQQ
jgi:ankyrin repeat protein